MDRRRVLSGSGAFLALAIAGCTGENTPGGGDTPTDRETPSDTPADTRTGTPPDTPTDATTDPPRVPTTR